MGMQQSQLSVSMGAQGCPPLDSSLWSKLASGTPRAQLGAVDSVGPQRALGSILEWAQGASHPGQEAGTLQSPGRGGGGEAL